VLDGPLAVWTEGCERAVRFQCVHSVDEAYVEVVQKVPGSVDVGSWKGRSPRWLFCRRPGGFTPGLDCVGSPLEVCGSIEGMHPDNGIRIEPVHRTVFGDFDVFEGMLDESGRKADHGQ
jgi:hypothetical protein